MRRREFMRGLAATVALPVAAPAQQTDRVRHISVLLFGSEHESEYGVGLQALRGGLQTSGWVEGRNLRMDLRYGDSDPARLRAYAEEFVKQTPDAIVVTSNVATAGRVLTGAGLHSLSPR
jgi:putative tryptophan/tyrosine transport system substrate-binding protein